MKKIVEKFRGYKVEDIAKLYNMNYAVIEVDDIEGEDEDGEYIYCGGIANKMILFYKGELSNYYDFIHDVYDREAIQLVKDGKLIYRELGKIADDFFIWSSFYKFDNILYIKDGRNTFSENLETVLYEDEYSTDITLTEKELRLIKCLVTDTKLKNKLEKALADINIQKE